MDQPRPKPIAPRQLRAVETRRRLLDAVETLVAAEGSAAVTTTRLAAETGVSVGTIYRYFSDREALLLAAYDATVERIVVECAAELGMLPAALAPADAADAMLTAWLDAAAAIPSHAGLLVAMRAIRPTETDQHGAAQSGILRDVFLPFLARYLPDSASTAPASLSLASVLISTMVDLYLVEEPAARPALRKEIAAHVRLMVERISAAR
ncbi:MAG: TetR/AcrR family transcriptional regulator [Rhizobiaceae bacterium]